MKIIYNYIANDADPYVKKLFGTVCVLNLFTAPFTATLLPLITKNTGLSDEVFGVSMALFTAGSVIASILMLKLEEKFKFTMRNLVLTNAILLIILGVIGNLTYMQILDKKIFTLLLLADMFFIGAITTLVNIPLSSGLQRYVDNNLKSKFFGVLGFVASILIPLGNFLVGMLLFVTVDVNILILFNVLSVIFILITFKKGKELA